MNISGLRDKCENILKELFRLRVVLFVALLVILYGFIVWRVNTYVRAEPSPSAVASQADAAKRPTIDPTVVDKVKKLQDNSVNVQTLFDQARHNPFQE